MGNYFEPLVILVMILLLVHPFSIREVLRILACQSLFLLFNHYLCQFPFALFLQLPMIEVINSNGQFDQLPAFIDLSTLGTVFEE